jgi:hypothetical protein
MGLKWLRIRAMASICEYGNETPSSLKADNFLTSRANKHCINDGSN